MQGYSTWGNPESLEPLRQLATTNMQRDLLRPPGVGGRTPLALPDAGSWGDSGGSQEGAAAAGVKAISSAKL